MKVPFLDLSRFDEGLQQELKTAFARMLEKGVFSGGEQVSLFSEQVKSKLGSKFTIPCSNGTDALELALRALGIGSGDEVIVPALTWVSTAEVVIMIGAKPIFWDTDQEGLLADTWDKAISPRTKAIIPVHLYGKMPNMKNLVEKAKRHQLFVIEDAAQAFGASQLNKGAGTWGDIGCLSFYPTKNLGALGEAGMCLTQDKVLAEKIELLSNHGQRSRDEHLLVGKNNRIDTLQAGFLNVFLSHWDSFQIRRKTLALRYLDGLSSISELNLPISLDAQDHSAHLFVILLEQRDELKQFLNQKGISTAIHYPRIVPEISPFQVEGDFQNAKCISEKGLSLPLNPWLREDEIYYVIESIKEFFSSGSSSLE